MKRFIIALSLVAFIGCNSSKEKNNNTSAAPEKAEVNNTTSGNLNDTVPYEGTVMLLGRADRTGLKMEAFKDWFKPGYEDYTPDPEIIEQLKPLLKDVDITVFMGTWCEDSHRDLPHLYKILDEANYDESKLQVYATSEEKTTPEGYEEGKNIIQVPTIIFYRNGEEINRIVEYSIYTVEQDMLNILSGKEYRNPYSE